MAGIEKVCEYSGEYGYNNMYSYKRDSIQILPQYRPLFRGQEHYLIFMKPIGRNVWSLDYGRKERYLKEYNYCLYVPALPGKVNGLYWNWSFNKSTVKRKLKRILRRPLNIKNHPLTIYEYSRIDQKIWR
jgi:hypothetical protein